MDRNNKGKQNSNVQSEQTKSGQIQIRERAKQMTTRNTHYTKARKAVSIVIAILMVALMVPVASFANETLGGGRS